MNCLPCFTRDQCKAANATWQKNGNCEELSTSSKDLGLCVPPCPTGPLMSKYQCEKQMLGYFKPQWVQYGQDTSKGLCVSRGSSGQPNIAPHSGQQTRAAPNAGNGISDCFNKCPSSASPPGCTPQLTDAQWRSGGGASAQCMQNGEVSCQCDGTDCSKSLDQWTHYQASGKCLQPQSHGSQPSPQHGGNGNIYCVENPCPDYYYPTAEQCGENSFVCKSWVAKLPGPSSSSKQSRPAGRHQGDPCYTDADCNSGSTGCWLWYQRYCEGAPVDKRYPPGSCSQCLPED